MKALHLMFFCLAWEFGFLVYAIYQEVTKAKKIQEQPVDSQGLTAGHGTYKSLSVDTTHTYDLKSNSFCKLLSIKNIDNFLQVIFLHGRFRADDSLCELLKKPYCKKLI